MYIYNDDDDDDDAADDDDDDDGDDDDGGCDEFSTPNPQPLLFPIGFN